MQNCSLDPVLSSFLLKSKQEESMFATLNTLFVGIIKLLCRPYAMAR